jgi:hypothetical protein
MISSDRCVKPRDMKRICIVWLSEREVDAKAGTGVPPDVKVHEEDA